LLVLGEPRCEEPKNRTGKKGGDLHRFLSSWKL